MYMAQEEMSSRRRIQAIATCLLRCNAAPVAEQAQQVAERRIASGKLYSAICRVLGACGADADVQEVVATHLIEANLRGHDSHGIQMISKYIKAFQNGKCSCCPCAFSSMAASVTGATVAQETLTPMVA